MVNPVLLVVMSVCWNVLFIMYFGTSTLALLSLGFSLGFGFSVLVIRYGHPKHLRRMGLA